MARKSRFGGPEGNAGANVSQSLGNCRCSEARCRSRHAEARRCSRRLTGLNLLHEPKRQLRSLIPNQTDKKRGLTSALLCIIS